MAEGQLETSWVAAEDENKDEWISLTSLFLTIMFAGFNIF